MDNKAAKQTKPATPAPEPITKDDRIEAIKKFTPKGQSPRIFLELVSKQVMGTDKTGKARPFEDLLMFMYVSHRAGLDPMAKQIYPVYRWDYKTGAERMTIQTGIDGFRLIAQRTGEYAGQEDIKYAVEDLWNPISGETQKQLTATAIVYKLNKKTGERMPVTATARWSEYVQKGRDGKPMGLWASMGYNQLGKCAEALALRKGFPAELSGLYTEDEMAQAAATSVTADLPTPKKFEKHVEATPAAHPAEITDAEANKIAAEQPQPAKPNYDIKPTLQERLAAKQKELDEKIKAKAAPHPAENTSSTPSNSGNSPEGALFGDSTDIGAMRKHIKPNDTVSHSA